MDISETGQRVVKSPHWKWLVGMNVVSPPKHDGATGYCHRIMIDGFYSYVDGEFPDLIDAATIGCFLGLLRDVLGTRDVYLKPEWNQSGEESWTCYVRPKNKKVWRMYTGYSEGEALMYALEKV